MWLCITSVLKYCTKYGCLKKKIQGLEDFNKKKIKHDLLIQKMESSICERLMTAWIPYMNLDVYFTSNHKSLWRCPLYYVRAMMSWTVYVYLKKTSFSARVEPSISGRVAMSLEMRWHSAPYLWAVSKPWVLSQRREHYNKEDKGKGSCPRERDCTQPAQGSASLKCPMSSKTKSEGGELPHVHRGGSRITFYENM